MGSFPNLLIEVCREQLLQSGGPAPYPILTTPANQNALAPNGMHGLYIVFCWQNVFLLRAIKLMFKSEIAWQPQVSNVLANVSTTLGQRTPVLTADKSRLLRPLRRLQGGFCSSKRCLVKSPTTRLRSMQLLLPDDSGKAKDIQSRYQVAKDYKSHIDQVGRDRSLEEFMQAFAFACNH